MVPTLWKSLIARFLSGRMPYFSYERPGLIVECVDNDQVDSQAFGNVDRVPSFLIGDDDPPPAPYPAVVRPIKTAKTKHARRT